MEKEYLNESHRKYSEACQAEVAEMSRHPLSSEQKEQQMDRFTEASLNQDTPQNKS